MKRAGHLRINRHPLGRGDRHSADSQCWLPHDMAVSDMSGRVKENETIFFPRYIFFGVRSFVRKLLKATH